MKTRQAASTDVGRVRSHNEDAFLSEPPLFAVADGMGGHHAGEMASSLALQTLGRGGKPGNKGVPAWLIDLAEQANKAIFEAGSVRGDSALRPGTTLTSAFVADDAIYIAHVGDSRAYLFHDGQVRQITDDHSLVAEWVREGRLSKQEALTHPQRSVITRALGIEPNVTVDAYRAVPSRGDRLLLCSDGLTGLVGDTTISDVLGSTDAPDAAVDKLIELANAGGGEDNITCVLVDFLEDPQPAPAGATTAAMTAVASVDPSEAPTIDLGISDPASGDLAGAGTSVLDPSTAPKPQTPDAQSPAGTPDGAAGAEDTVGIVVHPRGAEPEPPPEAVGKEKRARKKLRFWPKFTMWAVGFVAVIVLGWFGLRWFASNSYYIGVETGNVAIFTGFPQSVLGFSLGDLHERTNISASLLPEVQQEDVERGIPVDDLQDARRTVENLRKLATKDTTQVSPTTTTTTTTTTPPTLPAPGSTSP